MTNPAFNKALAFVLRFEGGYSNTPTDRGGETYCGISRRFNPDWSGWAILDGIAHFNFEKDKQKLAESVNGFYFALWNKLHINDLPENIACFIFDTAVNCGALPAGKIFQHALNDLDAGIQVDGIIGQQTVDAFRQTTISEGVILKLMQLYRIFIYWTIAQKNPKQRVFFYGWLNRTLTKI